MFQRVYASFGQTVFSRRYDNRMGARGRHTGAVSLRLLAFSLLLFGLSACTAVEPATERAVPWVDGDVLVYDVVESGKNTGTITYSFTRTGEGWLLESLLDAPEGSMLQGTLLDYDTLTARASYCDYLPTEVTEQHYAFRVDALYKDDVFTVTTDDPASPALSTLAMAKGYPMDDNSVLEQFLRVFDCKPGEPFGVALGLPLQGRTDVVTVGCTTTKTFVYNGESVLCRGVKVGKSGAKQAPAITLWYTADDARLLVRLETSRIAYTLHGVEE